jgi:hypothetical protein
MSAVSETEKTFNCPHCEGKLTEAFILSAAGSIVASKRKTQRGPKEVLYTCGCGNTFNANEIRKHSCDLKPARGHEKSATLAEREAFYAKPKTHRTAQWVDRQSHTEKRERTR